MGQKVSSPQVRREDAEVKQIRKSRKYKTASWRRKPGPVWTRAREPLGRYDSDVEALNRHDSDSDSDDSFPAMTWHRSYDSKEPLPSGFLSEKQGGKRSRNRVRILSLDKSLHSSETEVKPVRRALSNVWVSKPRSSGFLSEKTRPSGFLSEKPRSSGYLSEKPRSSGFLSEKPRSSGYLSEKTRPSGFLSEKPRSSGFLSEKQGGKRSKGRVRILSTLDKSLHSSETEEKPVRRALSNVRLSSETPSFHMESVLIQVQKHLYSDCTLSNVEIIEIKNIIKLNSEVDMIEFCDCKIANDYCTPGESQKNTAKCKISKLIISFTDHFKEFSQFFYSTFDGCEIKSLCLVYANLDDQDVENLQSFMLKKQVNGMESLDISYNKKITQIGFEQIGNMIAEQGIKTLTAINCDLEKTKLVKLFEGLKNVNLRELDIGYNDNLAKKGFKMLARLVANRGTEILKLRGCQLTDKTIKVFYNKLEENGEKVLLKKLDVSYNPEINPAGCKFLGRIIKKFGITTLNLAGCGISEEHLTSLISEKDIELHAINLRDNSYPGNIIIEIANIVSGFKIQELDISDCMLSASELRNFRTNLNGTKLQKLHLGDKGCELGMEYIEEVCQLLQSVNEMVYIWFHRLDDSCRRLLNEQSETLSVSIQLCNETQPTTNI